MGSFLPTAMGGLKVTRFPEGYPAGFDLPPGANVRHTINGAGRPLRVRGWDGGPLGKSLA